ncbi:nuclear transport factor 2 family protein [Nocardia sp. NEAU-G5]|uniref:Nuclear transport factor 2 family protein n=1 Tax=Nocardia albiluteola TaxID=2842303 RepID=A0ABS6BAY1_9NOCA|nr:nuclear transport factor 2 family protein [Nocardia albiluteola]MBU3067442.1 nuclear transport factor 2 family protein [Nocardia albiluteola]
MSDVNELVEGYLAAWNATEPQARQALVASVFAEDAGYTDPLVAVAGHAGLEATIAAVQGQFPGLEFSLGGPVDAHHDIARFTWHLGRPGGEPLVIGFDVAVIGADGRITQVLGFLDKVPAGA